MASTGLVRAEEAVAGGATGLIFGWNVWQREHDEALRFVAALRDVLSRHPVPAAAV